MQAGQAVVTGIGGLHGLADKIGWIAVRIAQCPVITDSDAVKLCSVLVAVGSIDAAHGSALPWQGIVFGGPAAQSSCIATVVVGPGRPQAGDTAAAAPRDGQRWS